ncbi:MAG: hypothetical protein A2W64_03370 [Candidatus Zambryskibacteria bacterium RIFCSPLOWO2_02_39_10]|nr:MAG: hypothetical protein A2W64_03370 [Candidatus Zambryskibacteria bacterium RIFCSPLOWO2_02_39_10]
MIQRILLFIIIILTSVVFLEIDPIKEPVDGVVQKEPEEIGVATSTSSISGPTESKPVAKSTKKSVSQLKPAAPAPTASIQLQIPTITEVPAEPPTDFETINKQVQKAVVNILCTTGGNTLSPVSGTGIIVSSEGVILTNAHVAEYFLLRDFHQKDFVQCIIRTDSPAYPRYYAELVYISPTWIENNKTILKEANPTGTGENDFAFLRITSAVDGSPLSKFDYVPLNLREIIDKGDNVVLVSYPAGFLGGITIQQNLNIVSAITTVQDFFTFNLNTIDIISVGGTVVSQKGASGGAVVDKYSSVLGIITTSSDGATTADRRLHAITSAYIDRAFQSETGISLTQLLSKDVSGFAKKFQNSIAPVLTKIITDELTKNQ